MPFDDDRCVLFPEKSAMHYWDGVQWVEWDGVLNVEIKNHNTDDRAYISPSHQLSVHETDDQTFDAESNNAAINRTISPGVAFDLEQFHIHLSAAGNAGDLTITLDANSGATYDVVILTQDMTAVTDFVWQPTRPLRFEAGDSLVIQWANAAARTYGMTTVYTTH